MLENILVKQREHLWLKMQKEVKKNTNFRLTIYECENYEDAEKAINSKNLEILIKKFDQKWKNKVKRTRELTKLIQII